MTSDKILWLRHAVDCLSPQREIWSQFLEILGNSKAPCIQGNLKSHVHRQSKAHAQKILVETLIFQLLLISRFSARLANCWRSTTAKDNMKKAEKKNLNSQHSKKSMSKYLLNISQKNGDFSDCKQDIQPFQNSSGKVTKLTKLDNFQPLQMRKP